MSSTLEAIQLANQLSKLSIIYKMNKFHKNNSNLILNKTKYNRMQPDQKEI
jgi:hypothetical protein